MSSKHYFPSTAVNTLVPGALRALVAANPDLALIEDQRVVINTKHDQNQVSLISGGGSGHEPSWSGYVGSGLLTAAACGDIFASPSVKQVLTAIAAVPSTVGHILLITNYTGDKLHFGLAAEKALAGGFVEKCVVLPATDDVSIGRSRSQKVGRRGLAGNSITMKILGAAAAKNYAFERCVEIGKAVNEQLVSIGSTLDHCHVPGRQNHEEIGEGVCVVGAGIHNEPGAEKLSPFPPVEDLVAYLLKLLCDPKDSERAFVEFDAQDDTVLLINNYGGLSNLELGALTHEILTQLDKTWQISPSKIYTGAFETSLNAPGFSITLFNASKAAKNSASTSEELLYLLSADTKAPAWPNVYANSSTKEPRVAAPRVNIERKDVGDSEGDVKVDPKILERAIRRACERAIETEPDLTKWDMLTGDGDCGEAVKGVCTAILNFLPTTVTTQTRSLLSTLHSITAIIDDMGGTLGAILSILLTAFTTSLRSQKSTSNPQDELAPRLAQALSTAMERLKQYTAARVRDRTVMDVLIPFSESLNQTGSDLSEAVKVAREAAEMTRSLKAGFGRASYVDANKKDSGAEGGGEGEEEIMKGEQGVPDPGAWAVAVFLEGMLDGIKEATRR